MKLGRCGRSGGGGLEGGGVGGGGGGGGVRGEFCRCLEVTLARRVWRKMTVVKKTGGKNNMNFRTNSHR